MMSETRTPLLTVALAIASAACGDASPASIVDVDVPVPGDPAIYAARRTCTSSGGNGSASSRRVGNRGGSGGEGGGAA